jgi:hypothetical protein
MSTSKKNIIVGSEGQGYWAKSYIDYVINLAFGKDIEIEWNNRKKPDFIVRTKNLKKEPNLPYKVPYICWSGEPFCAPKKSYPPLCSLNTFIGNTANSFHLPFAWFRTRHFLGSEKGEGEGLRKYTNQNRKHMIGACFSKPINKRVNFFKMLRSRFGNQVQGFGKLCNTIKTKIPGTFHNDDLMNRYSQCKFVFAMENCIKKGYITEKIINAYICGAVPIFWGDAQMAKKYFNPNTFICLNDFKSDRECADEIERINNDKEKWKEMTTAPIFVNEQAKRFFGIYYDKPAKEHLEFAKFLKENII